MKRITAVISAGAVGVLGLAVAVPALASTGPTSTAPASLTSTQQQSIEDFLADHPNLAQALAGRAADWQKLLAANPTLKTELDKVLALPADQRRAELKKWLLANPAAKKALQDYRLGLKKQRLTRQQDRLAKRQQRLAGKSSPGSSSKPSSLPGAATGSLSGATGYSA